MSGVFKSLKKIVAVAAPIVGAVVGGPVGAAIGGAVGGFASGKSFKGAIIGAGLSYAGASLAGSFLPGSAVTTGQNALAATEFAGAATASGGAIGGATFSSSAAGFLGGATSSLGAIGGQALSASSSFLPSLSTVTKAVTAINTLTGKTAQIGVNDVIPAGYTVDPNQTPIDVLSSGASTNPVGGATTSAVLPPVQTTSSQFSNALPYVLIAGSVFLLLQSRGKK